MPGFDAQHVQQLELLPRHVDLLRRARGRARRDGSSSTPRMLMRPAVAVGGRQRRARAPHQRRRARHQLAHAERLRQVVVGAAVEPHHFVGFLAPRGQHQNRRVAVRAVPPDRAA